MAVIEINQLYRTNFNLLHLSFSSKMFHANSYSNTELRPMQGLETVSTTSRNHQAVQTCPENDVRDDGHEANIEMPQESTPLSTEKPPSLPAAVQIECSGRVSSSVSNDSEDMPTLEDHSKLDNGIMLGNQQVANLHWT